MYVMINEKRYEIPEVNFDAVCELEEMGVEFLALNPNKPRLASTIRGLAAWVMGVDLKTASREIEAHIANGGNIADILEKITGAVQKSGFFAQKSSKQKIQDEGTR